MILIFRRTSTPFVYPDVQVNPDILNVFTSARVLTKLAAVTVPSTRTPFVVTGVDSGGGASGISHSTGGPFGV